jgi:hypothetical protein
MGKQKGREKTIGEHRSNLVGGKGCREENWKHIPVLVTPNLSELVTSTPSPPPHIKEEKQNVLFTQCFGSHISINADYGFGPGARFCPIVSHC